jgi:hypothetical protein
MHDDNLEGELFEGQVEISSLERGATFSLDEQSYFRLASFAMTAAGVGIQPSLICKLPGVERGCRLILFGSKYQFDVVVRALRLSRALIDVRAQPLDGSLHDVVALFSGADSDVDWSRALRHMCELEQIGFFDQFWAAEQGDGGEATL